MSRETFTVSQLARELDCEPREISDLFYRRVLPDEAAPIVRGRRLIPPSTIPAIVAALEERGEKIEIQEKANAQ